MKCPICKKDLEASLNQCPYCGTPLKYDPNKEEYIKTEFVAKTIARKTKEDLHKEYVQKNRTTAGILSIVSFPLMVMAIVFMLFAFIKFNDGTPGLTLTPYSICFLAPSFICAVVAFFKSKDINFKAVYRLSITEIIINAILILAGFIMLVLFTMGRL